MNNVYGHGLIARVILFLKKEDAFSKFNPQLTEAAIAISLLNDEASRRVEEQERL